MKLEELNKEYNNVSHKVKIHPTVSFYEKAVGIYIASGVEIDAYSRIYHHVTIGKRHGRHIGVPKIGKYVKIFAGAMVLGPVTIGDNAVVAAGALVLDDVPSGHMAVSKGSRAIIEPIDYSKTYPEMNKKIGIKDLCIMFFGVICYPFAVIYDIITGNISKEIEEEEWDER
jgi:serine O-acetyltransferase